jgi:hypothetical protein
LRLEGLGNLKNRMTSSGIAPMTFRLVKKLLNDGVPSREATCGQALAGFFLPAPAAPSDWHPEGQFTLVIDERSK